MQLGSHAGYKNPARLCLLCHSAVHELRSMLQLSCIAFQSLKLKERGPEGDAYIHAISQLALAGRARLHHKPLFVQAVLADHLYDLRRGTTHPHLSDSISQYPSAARRAPRDTSNIPFTSCLTPPAYSRILLGEEQVLGKALHNALSVQTFTAESCDHGRKSQAW